MERTGDLGVSSRVSGGLDCQGEGEGSVPPAFLKPPPCPPRDAQLHFTLGPVLESVPSRENTVARALAAGPLGAHTVYPHCTLGTSCG